MHTLVQSFKWGRQTFAVTDNWEMDFVHQKGYYKMAVLPPIFLQKQRAECTTEDKHTDCISRCHRRALAVFHTGEKPRGRESWQSVPGAVAETLLFKLSTERTTVTQLLARRAAASCFYKRGKWLSACFNSAVLLERNPTLSQQIGSCISWSIISEKHLTDAAFPYHTAVLPHGTADKGSL